MMYSRKAAHGDTPSALTAIRADLYRYAGSSDYSTMLRIWLLNRGFRYLVWFRIAQRARRNSVCWPVWALLLERAATKYGITIPGSTEIAPGFYIGYFGGIVVSHEAKIGPNCNIHKGVSIGTINAGNRAGTPCLEDSVWVGQNALVMGGITIGRGAVIAPGAFVNFDVPPGALVMGNPGTIRANTAPPGYVQFPVPRT
jgi:serine O-acetyltransferase